MPPTERGCLTGVSIEKIGPCIIVNMPISSEILVGVDMKLERHTEIKRNLTNLVFVF